MKNRREIIWYNPGTKKLILKIKEESFYYYWLARNSAFQCRISPEVQFCKLMNIMENSEKIFEGYRKVHVSEDVSASQILVNKYAVQFS